MRARLASRTTCTSSASNRRSCATVSRSSRSAWSRVRPRRLRTNRPQDRVIHVDRDGLDAVVPSAERPPDDLFELLLIREGDDQAHRERCERRRQVRVVVDLHEVTATFVEHLHELTDGAQSSGVFEGAAQDRV